MTIEEKIKSQFAPIAKVNEDEINMDANLFTQYGIDSLKAVKLISDVEVEFDIDIPDDTAQKICTLNDVISIIKKIKEPV